MNIKGNFKKNLVFGIGINDIDIPISANGKRHKWYSVWQMMLGRCYIDKYNDKFPKYKDCHVCNEWLKLSGFKKWFDDNYIVGYSLDKDILIKGNKIYSPETCCFVPPEINNLIVKHDSQRGILPIGVSINANNTYSVSVKFYGKTKYFGRYKTVMGAFMAYKIKKEEHIKDIATTYFSEGKINKNVFNALLNYNIEIND